MVAVSAVLFDQLDQVGLDSEEHVVHLIVKRDHLVGKSLIVVNKGAYALSDHLDRKIAHCGDVRELLDISIARHRVNKIADVSSLISEAFNVGDHLECSGHLAEIFCHRLLLEEDTHTLLFNCHLVFVHALIHHADAFAKLSVTVDKRRDGIRDHLLGKSAHLDELCF